MKVGDLVIRKVTDRHGQLKPEAIEQMDRCGHGIILSKQLGGLNPSHPCITVYYPKLGKIYDVAECLMEVVSECNGR